MAFSPDGTRVVSIGGGRGRFAGRYAVSVWDAREGLLIRPLPGARRAVCSVAFSPDGTRIVLALGDGLRVWDATTYKSSIPLMDPRPKATTTR